MRALLFVVAGVGCSRPATPVVAMGMAGLNACGIHEDGTVTCAGANVEGELGITPDTDLVPHPTPMLLPALASVVEVVGTDSHLCARLQDGSVQCWGASALLGDGNTYGQRPDPVTVPDLGPVVQLAANGLHTCALLADGTVRCWGETGSGAIGDGTTMERPTPTPAMGLTSVTNIAAGFVHTCARRSDGTVWCWGANRGGEVGNGTTDPQLVPEQVVGLSNAVQVVAGDYYSCALLADGTAQCWGDPTYGTLGDDVFEGPPRPTPGPVLNLSSAVRLAAGNSHVCALLSDTTVTCWGTNVAGEAGQPDPGAYGSPHVVQGLTGVTQLVAAGASTCAVLGAGEIRCWGSNTLGQLGDGTTTDRFSPTAVTF